MSTYKTPGVYIEEISTLPPSVAEVETAIPAFIGFTEKGDKNVARRITSMVDFQVYFGGGEAEKSLMVTVQNELIKVAVEPKKKSKNVLFYAMQLYFANGGGPCYIVPCGTFEESSVASMDSYTAALDAVAKEDEPTLLVFPDAPFILNDRYYDLVNLALDQCVKLRDRFVIIDVLHKENDFRATKDEFRTKVATNPAAAKYGAAYYPYLKTTLAYQYDTDSLIINGLPESKSVDQPATVTIEEGGDGKKPPERKPARTQSAGFSSLPNATQNRIKQLIAEVGVELTPAAAVAGVYAMVDSTRGVWKAPANVGLNYVKGLQMKITDDEQNDLNIDADSGKSVNAIRSFIGRGTKIWGARTLAGNDNEWRYVNVRRFFNMVEESVKKSTQWAVFEPNDINTWTKVRAMIENYLLLKWKDGALAGAKPDDAFFVRVGLGQTMTSNDVLEGRMNIEIGMAAVRPAEFIILKFSHKVQNS
ncbi:MAG TPA: phage tail sheath C-terminal domain-containing protein [Chitinophagaceae bacterium]